MNCTISTDASYSKKYYRGTYAFWITSNLGRVQKSGILRSSMNRPEVAEMMCICNSLSYLLKNEELLKTIKNIYINTDCLNAIHLFTGNIRAIRKYKLQSKSFSKVLVIYFKLTALLKDKKIEFRHIKSHEHTETPRNYVNDWVDKECGKQMEILLKKYRK